MPVARLTRAVERPAAGFDLEAFLAATTEQPLHTGIDPLHTGIDIAIMREGARY